MIELNLLPDVKKEYIRAQRTRNTVIAGSILTTIVAGGVLVVAALIVYGGQLGYIALKTGDIKKAQSELSATPEISKYLTVQNQLSNIDQLHSQKLIYSRALDFLEKINPAPPNNVTLSTATFSSTDGTLVVEGTASNFEAVGTFQATLTNAELSYKVSGQGDTQKTPLFTEVALNSVNVGVIDGIQKAQFKITLTLAQPALANTSTDATVTVPTLTLSDADTNAPREIFGTGGNN